MDFSTLFTDIGFWCSVAAIVVSIFSIIIMFLTRNNILDILDKDIILFDKNFELKKNAINEAMNIADEVISKGKEITLSAEFEERATTIYNSLLCIVTNSKIVDEFYSIAIDKNEQIDNVRVVKFKLACRRDIGLKNKGSKALKKLNKDGGIGAGETLLKTNNATSSSSFSDSTSAFASQPKMSEDKPVQPVRRPVMPQSTNPTQQARPAMPNQMQRPVARPTTPVRPMNRPTDNGPKGQM